MATFWRISNYADLSGRGGEKFASRWTSLGKRVVYLAECPPGALLEVLVHLRLRPDEIPDDFQLLEVEAPDGLVPRNLLGDARPDWREDMAWTQSTGDQWLSSLDTPLARVPSAIVPRTCNVMLNPLHAEASKVRVISAVREPWDRRLFGPGAH